MHSSISNSNKLIKFNQHSKAQLAQWIRALRSGEYQQTTGGLQDEDGMCCLGVACDLFVPKKKRILEGEFMKGGFPEDQKFAPEWLNKINVDFEARTTKALEMLEDGNDHSSMSLTDLNDDEGYTFEEIAICLELEYFGTVGKV